MRVEPKEIKTIKGQPVLLLRNQVIPVACIHEQLQVEKGDWTRKHIPLVIVGSAERRLALAVDGLLGNQEIVIKSLGHYVGKVPGIAGATILGDGKVAFILDISSIFTLAEGRHSGGGFEK
ncbi:Chemotaxis protein CheA [compost metagenome]